MILLYFKHVAYNMSVLVYGHALASLTRLLVPGQVSAGPAASLLALLFD